jgi:CRISPR-associated protein Cas2
VIVVISENIPQRLHGYLSRYFIEIRAGCYIGDFSIKVKDIICKNIKNYCEYGNAVVAYTANNDFGYQLDFFGKDSRRILIEKDGLQFIKFIDKEEFDKEKFIDFEDFENNE